MLESAQSSDWVVTKISSKSVTETVDRLKRFIEVRGFTLFRVIDHSGQAERVGLQMPEMKLVMFGKPTAGAAVMLAAPLAGLDLPLKILVWEDGNGASIGELQLTGIHGREVPPRRRAACAVRRDRVDR